MRILRICLSIRLRQTLHIRRLVRSLAIRVAADAAVTIEVTDHTSHEGCPSRSVFGGFFEAISPFPCVSLSIVGAAARHDCGGRGAVACATASAFRIVQSQFTNFGAENR